LSPVSGRARSAVSTDRPRFTRLSGSNSSYPAASADLSHALPRKRRGPSTMDRKPSLAAGPVRAQTAQRAARRGPAPEARRVSHAMSGTDGTVWDMGSRGARAGHASGYGQVAAAGTSVELFTGGGGLAMAMERAGFRHLLCNEFAHYACETLRTNAAVDYKDGADLPAVLGDPWPLIEGDVRGVDFTRLQGQVDVVAGGPPCQPFSLGGIHQGHEDKRNMFPEVFRVIRETRPKAIICENVRGLLRHSFRPYFDYILRELSAPFERRDETELWYEHDQRLQRSSDKEDGDQTERYDVYPMPVNAADYGAPQVRHRVIIVAFRRDLGIDWHTPQPTHSEAALIEAQRQGLYWEEHGLRPQHPGHSEKFTVSALETTQRWRTLRDAIRRLPAPVDKAESPGYLHHVGWPGARIYAGHTPNMLDWPAKTVKAGVHGVPGGESVIRVDDGSYRYMTVREVARVMTFSDRWWLAGPRGEQMRQLGNAVPVTLGEVFTKAVAGVLNSRPNPQLSHRR
jgi:DNA (cytosine-5)-methyltransferase 1